MGGDICHTLMPCADLYHCIALPVLKMALPLSHARLHFTPQRFCAEGKSMLGPQVAGIGTEPVLFVLFLKVLTDCHLPAVFLRAALAFPGPEGMQEPLRRVSVCLQIDTKS